MNIRATYGIMTARNEIFKEEVKAKTGAKILTTPVLRDRQHSPIQTHPGKKRRNAQFYKGVPFMVSVALMTVTMSLLCSLSAAQPANKPG